MKKCILTSVLFFFFILPNFGQNNFLTVVTSDIDNFWDAYDKIITTKDTLKQYDYLNKYYIDKGSNGLKEIMQLRNYSPKNYIDAINKYPLFWMSIRPNTYKSKQLSPDLEVGILQLKKMYPPLKPSTLYFTIGSFRTNGTISNNTILIGSEMALANKNTVTTELPDYLQYYYSTLHPMDNIVLLTVHECVHNQQKPMVHNLLSYCLYEGVAEFVSTKATRKPSFLPAIEFGKANEAKVKAKFESDLFKMNISNDWLWSTKVNEFKMRDIGYYVGYAICENYYNKASDKEKAIKDMIELDYENTEQFEQFVDQSGYLSVSLKKLYDVYDKSRPYIVSISQFENNSKNVNPKLTTITLNFSIPMDKETRGFDYGPLGEDNVLRVSKVIGFSEDGRSFTYEVELQPNHHYQSLITNRFSSVDGIALKPFLIDITTSK
ncbi:MAG: hypothetical protein V4648_05505 [Bacteroidota bacterium]